MGLLKWAKEENQKRASAAGVPEGAQAKVEYQIKDAHEAMRNAIAMNNWAAVAKYASQLQKMAADFTKATGGGVLKVSPDGKTSKHE
jgi:hypothetical protein